jgi:hypothetical protein
MRIRHYEWWDRQTDSKAASITVPVKLTSSEKYRGFGSWALPLRCKSRHVLTRKLVLRSEKQRARRQEMRARLYARKSRWQRINDLINPTLSQCTYICQIQTSCDLYTPWGRRAQAEVLVHSFLTSAVEGGQWLASAPATALRRIKPPAVPLQVVGPFRR